ncbi:MAG TPA: AAA family ATPase [Gemmatimonadaceae bacterium]|nr:AAA family ATPase [Gemmatimonadaceae bacterium]
MYEEFYGLTEKPFALTPNPRFVFQSEQYRTAEDALMYGVAQKEGFMLVTGAPGTGKTTLCRDLLEKLDPSRHRVALLFNPFLNGVEMLQALLSEFGLGDTTATSRKELLDRLNTYLLQQLANGRTCIAIFDEAQHLSTEFLEQIRVLSNLETESEKLIQIVLVGQPELLALIRTPQMAQLDQRVSVRCTLTHLSRDETGRYIYHRLNVAGSKGRVKFEDSAVRLIHAATGGVPRLINLACDRSLLAGYAEQARTIKDAHVRQALASLRGEDGIENAEPETPRTLKHPARPRAWALAVATALVLLLAGALAWWRYDVSAELLAWQAGRMSSARDAEQIYARIAREHRASRQRPNALLRLAQLQIARGSTHDALGWLEILRRDYPSPSARSERQYWTSRALLTSGDTAQACTNVQQVSAAAEGSLAPDFAELRKQCAAFAAETSAADSTTTVQAVPDTASVRPAGAPVPKLDATP